MRTVQIIILLAVFLSSLARADDIWIKVLSDIKPISETVVIEGKKLTYPVIVTGESYKIGSNYISGRNLYTHFENKMAEEGVSPYDLARGFFDSRAYVRMLCYAFLLNTAKSKNWKLELDVLRYSHLTDPIADPAAWDSAVACKQMVLELMGRDSLSPTKSK